MRLIVAVLCVVLLMTLACGPKPQSQKVPCPCGLKSAKNSQAPMRKEVAPITPSWQAVKSAYVLPPVEMRSGIGVLILERAPEENDHTVTKAWLETGKERIWLGSIEDETLFAAYNDPDATLADENYWGDIVTDSLLARLNRKTVVAIFQVEPADETDPLEFTQLVDLYFQPVDGQPSDYVGGLGHITQSNIVVETGTGSLGGDRWFLASGGGKYPIWSDTQIQISCPEEHFNFEGLWTDLDASRKQWLKNRTGTVIGEGDTSGSRWIILHLKD